MTRNAKTPEKTLAGSLPELLFRQHFSLKKIEPLTFGALPMSLPFPYHMLKDNVGSPPYMSVIDRFFQSRETINANSLLGHGLRLVPLLRN